VTTPDDLADSMVPVACHLASLVRGRNLDAIAARLRGLSVQERDALIIVQAAMIPADEPVGDLLAWTEETYREELLREAHAEAVTRWRRGLPVEGRLAEMDREYQAVLRQRKAAAREGQRAA
jgi:hypothetical protein